MAMAYRLIKGEEQKAVPQIQPLDQRQMLLSLLPEEFETKQLVEEAKAQGISRRTIFLWNEDWQKNGVVVKIKHGVYKKQMASA